MIGRSAIGSYHFLPAFLLLILCVWMTGGVASARAEDFRSILWGQLKTLDGFGPRYVGSSGHESTRRWIRETGEKYADEVREQRFTLKRSGGEPVTLANYELVFRGAGGGRPVLVGAHYDTRPYADEERDAALHSRPISGANDGGSGTAVLLGLARYLHDHKPRRPVILAFFDGEDFGAKSSGEILIGSSFYAAQLEQKDKAQWPRAVIVVDMVGDKSLEIFRENNSVASAAWLVDLIVQTARDNGIRQFKENSKHSIWDDHSPFIRLDIPSALLIDFDYPYWHTLQDTLDKCSPESLYAVFVVVAETLKRLEGFS